MQPTRTELLEGADPDLWKWVNEKLREENIAKLHRKPPLTPFRILQKDETGNVVGAMVVGTFWDWYHIDLLWLADGYRQQGLGSSMVKMLEDRAIRDGAVGIYVNTISIQAPGFYEKLGYQRFGHYEDCPYGHQRICFKKRMTTEPPKDVSEPEAKGG